MTLLASLCTAVAVYFGVGILSGWTPPRRGRRKSSKTGFSRARQWLAQAGANLTVGQFVLGSGALGLATFFLVALATGAWWLGVVPGAGVAVLPGAFYSKKRTDRLRQLHRAWPDALGDILAAIGAGSTLVVALGDLAETGPAALRPTFGRFRLLSRMMGVLPALELVKEQLADPTSDRVIEVLSLAYEHGGGLVGTVLRDLADEIAEDLRLEAEIRSDGTEQRIESRVVLVIPWVLLLFLSVTSEEYRAYYQSSSGLIVVTAAVVWSLFGFALMRYIGRSAAEQRVLVRPGQGSGTGAGG